MSVLGVRAMGYTVLRGSFVIRYPDLPRQGPQPDGDTVKFKPDTPALVDTLPRRSGRPAQINSRGISVRLEAIDALETHFDNDHQELAGGTAARDALLARLEFTVVTSFPDARTPSRSPTRTPSEVMCCPTASTPEAGLSGSSTPVTPPNPTAPRCSWTTRGSTPPSTPTPVSWTLQVNCPIGVGTIARQE
jgi:hypothetical protein